MNFLRLEIGSETKSIVQKLHSTGQMAEPLQEEPTLDLLRSYNQKHNESQYDEDFKTGKYLNFLMLL